MAGAIGASQCTQCPAGERARAGAFFSCLLAACLYYGTGCLLALCLTWLTDDVCLHAIGGAGTFANAAHTACENCPAGEFQSQAGFDTCNTCPANTKPNTARTACEAW